MGVPQLLSSFVPTKDAYRICGNFFQLSVAAILRPAPQGPEEVSHSRGDSLSVSPSGFLAGLVSFDTSGDAARRKNQLHSHLSAKAADSHLACVQNQMCRDTLLLPTVLCQLEIKQSILEPQSLPAAFRDY